MSDDKTDPILFNPVKRQITFNVEFMDTNVGLVIKNIVQYEP